MYPTPPDAPSTRFMRPRRSAASDAPDGRYAGSGHGAASLLLLQGVPSRVVMDVLGHSQIAVTLNACTHVMPTLVDEAAEAMDRALGSGSAH
jgi:hypothetical protein